MLPPTLPSTSEPGTFLNSLETATSPVSAGKEADAPMPAFATILDSSGPGGPPAILPAGDRLPVGGNGLPPLPPAHLTAPPADPDEIVASLEQQIARVLSGGDTPAVSSTVAADIAADGLVDERANAPVDQIVDLRAPDSAVTVDEAALTDSVPAGTVAPDPAGDLAVPVAEHRAPVDTAMALPPVPPAPIAVGDTATDPRTRRVDAPATDPARVPRLRDTTPATAPLPARPAADTARPVAALSASAGATSDAATDNRINTISYGAGASGAALTNDVGSETLNPPRAVLVEAASPASIRQPTSAPTLPTPATIDIPVQDPAWDRAVSERVVMMAANRTQTAEIRLSPAELGPLRVQVAVDDGAAHVTFSAQHAVTRDALEQALPRLREMLADTGIQLGEARVDVDHADSRQQRGEAGGTATFGLDEARSADSDQEHDAPVAVRAPRGLVDTFV